MSRKNKQISGGSAKGNPSLAIILGATRSHPLLSLGILVTVVGAVIASLLGRGLVGVAVIACITVLGIDGLAFLL